MLHDDQLKDGEWEEDRDPQWYLLPGVWRQPEHIEGNADHKQCRQDDVDQVVAELAGQENGEANAVKVCICVCVLCEVFYGCFGLV